MTTQKTYKKWKESVITDRMENYDCNREDASFWLDTGTWWLQNIQPALVAGEMLTLSVCRSLIKNRGGSPLIHIDKHYPGQMPKVYYDTGKLVSQGCHWRA